LAVGYVVAAAAVVIGLIGWSYVTTQRLENQQQQGETSSARAAER
jgi:hypothetical protein